jgi:hypothetical protein
MANLEHRAEKTLHEFQRAGQEQVILTGALLNAAEQCVIFVHERRNQRPVIVWQDLDKLAKIAVLGQP